MKKQNRQQRRGVTLLLVLGLMSMFAMLIVTFMIVTTQARSTAETAAKEALNPSGRHGSAFSSELDEALNILLVGDAELKSAVGPHGLLENLYGHPAPAGGNDAMTGNFVGVDTLDGMLEIRFDHSFFNAVPHSDYLYADLIGSVLTVSEVPTNATTDQKKLENKSTIILDFKINNPDTSPTYLIYAAPFPIADLNLTAQQQELENGGSNIRYIINSPAFSGTGPGFDPASTSDALLSKEDEDGVPFALRPNHRAPEDDGSTSYLDALKNGVVLMNPDYTAPDYLNMFLAWYDVDNNSVLKNLIPSFHRPQLISYHDSAGDLDDYTLLRKIVLRPLPFDHPDFSGSNPAAALSADPVEFLKEGPWDVDNDGDGIADGIWLDLGFAPITEDSGKMYKPLFSFLVLDMDGRININVHGNEGHLDANFDTYSSPFDKQEEFGSIEARGAGSGSAELRLYRASGSSVLEEDEMKDLLFGAASQLGRYGDQTGSAKPGNPNDKDSDLSSVIQSKMGINPLAYGYSPVSGSGPQAILGVGGMPPDLWGNRPLAFDPLGNRYFAMTAGENLYAGNPYLMNPYSYLDGDDPFQPDQFQYMLRSPGDVDFSALPERLKSILDDHLNDAEKWSDFRFLFTSRSSDIPSPSRFGGSTSDGTTTTVFPGLFQAIQNWTGSSSKTWEIVRNLPVEIRRGEKINLNRLALDPKWTDPTDAAMLKEKSNFAHGIYLLLSILCEDRFQNNHSESGFSSIDEMRTRLAQWAVNLVDFMDADSVMTPMVYSLTPFTDTFDYGDIFDQFIAGSDGGRKIVWGMEKPEIALTETFAVHNRRVADTALEDQGKDPDNDQMLCEGDGSCGKSLSYICPNCEKANNEHDKDFDQVLVPEGSLFVELYRQGNPGRAATPGDLTIDTSQQLDLGQTINGAPVWRLAIGEQSTTAKTEFSTAWDDGAHNALAQSQDDARYSLQPPNQWPAGGGATGIVPERFIWFTAGAPSGIGPADLAQRSYWRSSTTTDVSLAPNQRLVIGPRPITSFQSKPVVSSTASYGEPVFGEDDELPEPPDGNENDPGYLEEMADYTAKKQTQIKLSDLRSSHCKTMIAEASATVGVSVSEPTLAEGHYSVDSDDQYKLLDGDELYGFGTIPCYRTILLQRLADPTRSYHAVSNPYITVDWNMIDLHVINSESNEDPASPPALTRDKETKDDVAIPANDLYFTSRKWGITGIADSEGKRFPNPWSRTIGSGGGTDTGGLPTDASVKIAISDARIECKDVTLGQFKKYIIKPVEGEEVGDGNEEEGPNTVSPLTATEATGSFNSALYADAPKPGFLHFPWYDAPLSNAFELMLVPACTVDRFGLEFNDSENDPDWFATPSLGGSGMRFGWTGPGQTTTSAGPYLNFFHATTASEKSLDLYRLFEYVRVPSRFVGTIRDWTGGASPQPIYEMREPGKINLNTATDKAWQAITNTLGISYSYDNFRELRGDHKDSYNDDHPTEFHKPFRSPNGVNLVPNTSKTLSRQPGKASLLQENVASTGKPIIPTNDETGDGTNPHTVLEKILRLGDMTTTRSNVFAVWVTVGFFEVEKFEKNNVGNGIPTEDVLEVHSELKNVFPSDVTDAQNHFETVYPDGCVLGKEVGVNEGLNVRRYRKFYLIDRSVPVGFRRGEKLNTNGVKIFSTKLEQ